MKNIAIVTGATGGIGSKFIEYLLNENLDEIWAIARNENKLNALRQKFGQLVLPVPLDLTDDKELLRLSAKLNREKPEIKYLVNNAGTAKFARSLDFSNDEISKSIALSCKAPVVISNMCIPYMKKGDRILNISSAASFQPNCN